MKKIRNILKCTKGESYIDVVVLILIVCLLISLAVNLFPIYMTKQKLDTFATEIMREAEIYGRIGAETTAEETRLRETLGIAPTITWSQSGNVQLNHEIEVELEIEVSLGFGGSFTDITLKSKAQGKSEVYFK